MTNSLANNNIPPILRVVAEHDRNGQTRGLGVSSLAFKVTSQDTSDFFVVENVFHDKGGPARHLHFNQDEWFYCIEGEFVIEIGSQKFHLNAGDSVFAPRNIPHVWAYIGDATGKMLITFTPPGQMEAFFKEVTKANAMPPLDPDLWLTHGMELLGPPLTIE
ncbi:MAG: cupin domain-containing protein [Phototrophicaceae bacterium]